MRNVVFVAPFFLETTLRFVDAVASLPGVRLGLISQDPASRLPPGLRAKIAAHETVTDALDPAVLSEAVGSLRDELGSVDRLLGALEELQVPLGEIRDAFGIAGVGAETAENFRDKARMKSVLAAHGLPCARHVLATSVERAVEGARALGYPLVVKPPAGSGARRTFRVDEERQLLAALAPDPPTADHPALVEEFVTGEELSFDSIMLDGEIVWHSINHYIPGPLEVLREPWIQWCVLLPREVDAPEYDAIRSAAADSLRVLGLVNGLTHMEWFQRPDGSVAVSEVGARPPGAQFTTLISWAHDFDLYAAWARLMVFDEFEPQPRPYAAGAAYLRGQGRGRIQTVHGLEQVRDELGPLVVEARLPREGQSSSGTYEGEGYIILRHPETAVVEKGLRRIVNNVRVELG